MKKLLQSFTTFSRSERIGIIALCAVILVLICIRATMYLWVHPHMDTEQQQRLSAAWATYKSTVPITPASTGEKSAYQDTYDDNPEPLPAVININTADSATLVRLKGIGPATAGKIIAWRKENGNFTSVDQLLEIRHIPAETFELLKKHLTVK